MHIRHITDQHRFYTETDGYTAYVDYIIVTDGLDIRHTVVPSEIGGRGIASTLVRAAYDYALAQGLRPIATCHYAAHWLEKHPEYHGITGPDYTETASSEL